MQNWVQSFINCYEIIMQSIKRETIVQRVCLFCLSYCECSFGRICILAGVYNYLLVKIYYDAKSNKDECIFFVANFWSRECFIFKIFDNEFETVAAIDRSTQSQICFFDTFLHEYSHFFAHKFGSKNIINRRRNVAWRRSRIDSKSS